jgi:sorbitol-specific phosphotransferase system component IIBC
MTAAAPVPGWEGTIGPFPGQYHLPHVYARDVQSGAGNCVCGLWLAHARHVQAAPGVPIPERMRT